MSLPKYPEYKDSGVSWLGEVPAHWLTKKVKFLTSRISSGKTPLGGSETYVNSGVVFLRSQNVYDEGLRLEDVVFISDVTDELMANSRVECGDILLNITGASIGRSCLVPSNFPSANVNQHVCVIRPIAFQSALFISWVFKSYVIKRQIEFAQNGAAREGLNFEQIGGMVMSLPPLNEQESIAAFLDRETAKIDALIAEQEKLIALLAEKRQATISQAVTRGLDPNVPLKDSGVPWLGKVPAHWEIKPLRYCVDYQEGPGILAEDFRDEGIPLLRVAGVQSNLATLDGCNFLDPDKVSIRWNHFRLLKGDLLISASASMGTVCEVGDDAVGAVAYTGIIRLRGKEGVMIRDFIRYMVVSWPFLSQIDLLKAGATIQHYGPTHLSQMFAVCPPVKEQESISDFIANELARAGRLMQEAKKTVALLHERRAALISAAVTGKIDVRGLAA